MPLPLNQKQKRLSIRCPMPAGPSAAESVPAALNMEASGGSPTQRRAPESDNPLSSVRRESRNRLVITCDTSGSSLGWEFPRQNQRGHEFLKLELRALEIRGDPRNQRAVAG